MFKQAVVKRVRTFLDKKIVFTEDTWHLVADVLELCTNDFMRAVNASKVIEQKDKEVAYFRTCPPAKRAKTFEVKIESSNEKKLDLWLANSIKHCMLREQIQDIEITVVEKR